MTTVARFERALALEEAGDFEGALREFTALLRDAKDSESKTDYIYGQLLSLTRLGRSTEARKVLGAARKLFDNTGEMRARADLVEVQIDSLEGNWEHPLKLLQKMVKRDGEMLSHPQVRDVYEEVQWRRGILLASFGKFEDCGSPNRCALH